MDNKLIFENYLLVLKSSVEVYVHGTLESANTEVRSLLKKSLNNIMSMQADTYDLMQENGWYQTKNVDIATISETLKKIENEN